MEKRETQSPASSKVPSSGTALLIFGTIADTTWRLFVPVLGLLFGGMWLDGKTGRKPLFALAGVIIGFLLAAGLMYQQYRQVTPKAGKK